MEIDIPSNYYSFELNIKVETKKLSKIRIVSLDPNKPATKYGDRVGKLLGQRIFNLKSRPFLHDCEFAIVNALEIFDCSSTDSGTSTPVDIKELSDDSSSVSVFATGICSFSFS